MKDFNKGILIWSKRINPNEPSDNYWSTYRWDVEALTMNFLPRKPEEAVSWYIQKKMEGYKEIEI